MIQVDCLKSLSEHRVLDQKTVNRMCEEPTSRSEPLTTTVKLENSFRPITRCTRSTAWVKDALAKMDAWFSAMYEATSKSVAQRRTRKPHARDTPAGALYSVRSATQLV